MRHLITGLIFIGCFAFCLNAFSQNQSHQVKGSADYARGETLYRNNCQFCHGVRGDGNGPASYSMYPKPADFTAAQFWKNMNDEKIAQVILQGRGMMPAFKYPSEDVKAVIDFIAHFKK